MPIAGLVRMLPTTNAREARPASGRYDQLLHTVFRPDLPASEGKTLAFTAASRGAGTTHVIEQVGLELAKYAHRRTLIADAGRLRAMRPADVRAWLDSVEAERQPLAALPCRPGENDAARAWSRWQESAEERGEILRLLREAFDYVLIDCAPVSAASDVLLLTRLVDGVVIVVAAGETRREQIEHCQRAVETAEGTIAGFILNKRRYPAPGWLYHRL